MIDRRLVLAFGTTLLSIGCAERLQAQYVLAGYDSASADATKHVNVAAWAEDEELARLAARVASERIKLKKNYLVYDDGLAKPSWSDSCKHEDAEIEGVLVVRMLRLVEEDGDVDMDLEGRLMRCSDGALLWRAEVSGKKASKDEDLASFAESYSEEFQTQAPRMAIPLLVNLIALLDALPDVILSEEEEFTKIELS